MSGDISKDNEQIKSILDNAIKGNEIPFNRFFKNTFDSLLPRLKHFIESEEEAKEIFVITMQKFWECFVIKQQKVPSNCIGYIYIMCKNTWLLQKKKYNNTIPINDQILNYYKNLSNDTNENEFISDELMNDDQFLKHKALTKAIEDLSPKCKTLIEVDLDPDIKLKNLQKTLGYDNYQALVQAKYNCKKRLIKKVYDIIYELKKGILLKK